MLPRKKYKSAVNVAKLLMVLKRIYEHQLRFVLTQMTMMQNKQSGGVHIFVFDVNFRAAYKKYILSRR